MFKNYDFSTFNYLEIDILNNNKNKRVGNADGNADGNVGGNADGNADGNIIDVNWSKNDFIKFLEKLMKTNKSLGLKNNRPFEKQYRVLKYNNLTYIKNISDNKFNLFNLSFVDKEIINNILCMKYKRENLAIFQFPSTNKMNDEFYLNKIIFKITNLIYLNFEIMKKNEIEIFYRVYINFNNDKKNIDHNLIIKNLEDIIIKINGLLD